MEINILAQWTLWEYSYILGIDIMGVDILEVDIPAPNHLTTTKVHVFVY